MSIIICIYYISIHQRSEYLGERKSIIAVLFLINTSELYYLYYKRVHNCACVTWIDSAPLRTIFFTGYLQKQNKGYSFYVSEWERDEISHLLKIKQET